MCGIVLVQGQINPDRLQAALQILQRRGPDFTVTHQRGPHWLAQTVLHITGSDDFYHSEHQDAFVFNGEIYNWQQFGAAANDTETAWRAARDNISQFQGFNGPWAWIRATEDHVWYATDPQGEHCLYRYHTPDLTVVASDVATVQQIVSTVHQSCDYVNKCWTMLDQTPWAHIERLTPGMLYQDHDAVKAVDSIWNWISPQSCTLAEAQEQFDHLWPRVMQEITPSCDYTISYSGGVDSSLILSQLPQANLVAVNMQGKDPIVERVRDFLTADQLSRLQVIDVDFEHYAQQYRDLIEQTQMPVQSWSFVGKWLVAQHMTTPVLFTGLAADELFGGYPIYQTMQFDQRHSVSPYSQHDHAGLWTQCLAAYHGDARPATLLMDYWYQVVGCDAPGQHRIAGAWGRETRNPFMHRQIMQFALNLPWEVRVNTVCKPVLTNSFLKHWPAQLLMPKQGFAGHANDSLPWMGVTVPPSGDRYQDWKQIAKETYFRYTTALDTLVPLDH